MKKRRIGVIKVQAEEKPKKKNERTYVNLIEPQEMTLDEKSKLVFSVSREDKEDAETKVDIRTFIETPRYTGPTQKGITFSIYDLDRVLDILNSIKDSIEEEE